jgi:hypothetical protein
MENSLFNLLSDSAMSVVACVMERVGNFPVGNFVLVNVEAFIDATNVQMRHANNLVGPIE